MTFDHIDQISYINRDITQFLNRKYLMKSNSSYYNKKGTQGPIVVKKENSMKKVMFFSYKFLLQDNFSSNEDPGCLLSVFSKQQYFLATYLQNKLRNMTK